MKMTPEHYSQLKSLILPLAEKYPFELYQKEGLSAERWRWDLLWATRLNGKNFIAAVRLSDYLNDNNIDTALRRITNTK